MNTTEDTMKKKPPTPSERDAARSAPRTEPALSPRDRAILAPLLAIIDADLSSTDAGRALAAVRAVVGVERG